MKPTRFDGVAYDGAFIQGAAVDGRPNSACVVTDLESLQIPDDLIPVNWDHTPDRIGDPPRVPSKIVMVIQNQYLLVLSGQLLVEVRGR